MGEVVSAEQEAYVVREEELTVRPLGTFGTNPMTGDNKQVKF